MTEDVKQEFKKVYKELKCKAPCGGGAVSLPLNSIQYNNGGVFGGSSDLLWDNTLKTLTAGDPNPAMMLNTSTYTFFVGDNDHVNNGNVFFLDDSSGICFLALSTRFGIDNENNQGGLFRVEIDNKLCYLGDFSNFYAVSGTYISVEVLTGLVKITTVPTYANDAAAITGGLTSGHLYKKTTAGVTNLCIVP